jgi:hypothetical protein
VVDSSELSSKTLRASDYVVSPRRLAERVVAQWGREFPVVNVRGAGGSRLRALVEEAIREAIEKRGP